MLLDVQVEHPGDERPLQPRAQPLEHVHPRAGDLYAALEVDDAEVDTGLPVRFHRELAFPNFADGPHYDILAIVLADRHLRHWHVRDLEHQVVELPINVRDLRIHHRDRVADLLHLSDKAVALVRILRFRNRLRALIASRLELIDLGDEAASLRIELNDPVDRRGGIEQIERMLHLVWPFADDADVDHVCSPSGQNERPGEYRDVRKPADGAGSPSAAG